MKGLIVVVTRALATTWMKMILWGFAVLKECAMKLICQMTAAPSAAITCQESPIADPPTPAMGRLILRGSRLMIAATIQKMGGYVPRLQTAMPAEREREFVKRLVGGTATPRNGSAVMALTCSIAC